MLCAKCRGPIVHFSDADIRKAAEEVREEELRMLEWDRENRGLDFALPDDFE